MSDINYGEIGKIMLPIFDSLVKSSSAGDYESFLKHHPPVSKAQFDEAVSILKPLGKPILVEYLGHLAKLDRIKVLCKVSYSESVEELLWDFNLTTDDGDYQLVNLGFDK